MVRVMDIITKRFIVFLRTYISTDEKQKEYLLRLNDSSDDYTHYLKKIFGGRCVTVREIIVSIEHFDLEPMFLFYDDPIDIINKESVIIGSKMRDIIVGKRYPKELLLNLLKLTERELDDYVDGKSVIPAYKLKKFAQITETSLSEFGGPVYYPSEKEIQLKRTIESFKEEFQGNKEDNKE